MIGGNNLQAGYWTEDPAKCNEFLAKVKSRVIRVSKFASQKFQVGAYQEDIVSEIEIDFLQQMHDKKIPFAEASPEEAADFFLEKENFWILNRGRSIARRIARQQSKEQPTQAEILADVRQPDLSPDREKELRALAASLPRLESEIPNFSSRDHDIFVKEALRKMGIDDLQTPSFDEVVQIAGGSGSEQRAYNEYHDEHRRNSPSDRKAWSRAKAKVKKAFTKGKFTSLLGIIFFAVSLALLTSINQERPDHQKGFVDQNCPVYLMALSKGHQRAFLKGHQ